MKRTDANTRLQRMDLIAARLKQDGYCTVADLARQHGVSTRTIARDLALMRDRGLPVEADRGRGGGVRIDRQWGVGRLNLAYSEAIDLLISIEVAEQMKSPLFLAALGSVRRQLIASFSAEKRSAVARLKSRIIIGVTASTNVQSGVSTPPPRVVRALHQAFVDRETIDLSYRREDGVDSSRRIEPHYLLLKYPVWYVVAFDHLRGAPRSFRCDRIPSARATGERFRLRPLEEFRSNLLERGLIEA